MRFSYKKLILFFSFFAWLCPLAVSARPSGKSPSAKIITPGDFYVSLLTKEPDEISDATSKKIYERTKYCRLLLLHHITVKKSSGIGFLSKPVIEIIRPGFSLKTKEELLAELSDSYSMKSESIYEDSGYFPDGQKILDMLENGGGNQMPPPEEEGDTEKVFTDRNGILRNFNFGKENFCITKESGKTVFNDFYGEKLVRKIYDEELRLSSSEIYKIGKSARDYELSVEKNYFYDGSSNVLLRTLENKKSEKRQVECEFLENGKISSVVESEILEDGQLRRDKIKSFAYDEKSRILEEKSEVWFYKTDSFGKEKSDSLVSKNVYSYHDDVEDIPPDLSYYENETLRLKRESTSPTDSVQTTYFDGGFSVKVFYKNGVKTSEIIYFNNVEQRKRYFEH